MPSSESRKFAIADGGRHMSAALPSNRFWVIGMVIVVSYTTLNTFAVFVPFIPSFESLIAWVFLLPLIAGLVVWGWLVSARRSFSGWWTLGLALSFWFLCLAFLSLQIITVMWAAV